MIPPQTAWYRQALAKPHSGYGRVEVWRGGIQVEELVWRDPKGDPYARGMPVFLGGSVRATLNSRTTRYLTLSLPDYLYPWKVTDLLAPYGQELRAFRGIRYGSGTVDEFPVFRGPVVGVRPGEGGRMSLSASDLAGEVASAGFAVPSRAQVGTLVVAEFKRLVLDVIPEAIFGPLDPLPERVPELSYDLDRGAGLDNLAKTATAFWYALGDGRFVIRRVPWTAPVTAAPIVLTDGAGGTLLKAYPDRTREGIFNRVTVTSERADGGPPLFYTADDDDPTSPTYVGGPFRIKATQVRVTGAVNEAQVRSAAEALVQRSKARTDAWQMTCVPDGSIELGDPLAPSYKGHDALQLVAGLTMPLDSNTAMTIDGRDLVTSDVDL